MRIEIWLHNTSQPIVREHVKNAYEKGAFYCILTRDLRVEKYPLATIWRVVEDYETA